MWTLALKVRVITEFAFCFKWFYNQTNVIEIKVFKPPITRDDPPGKRVRKGMRKDQLPSQSCNLVDRNARTSDPLGDLVAAMQGKKEPAIAGTLVNILKVSVFTEGEIMFKIEKGIPIPKTNNGRKSKYPFRDMEVGDSIYVADNPLGARNSAVQFGRRNGLKFSTRSEGDGIRIWRIE